ncbi:MAG: MBL fold metallo-hydrolase [Rhodospirillales bacterium]|nr:MBL fold metallo-hydrolase [Rhodospirillales bacterium]
MLNSLSFPFARTPEPGCLIEVAPGVQWARMPMPFRLDHVNVWLLRDEGGWAAVDTGYPLEENAKLWEEILADGLGGEGLSRMICTHYHPDHVGLCGWLCEKYTIDLTATFGEWAMGRLMSTGAFASGQVMEEFYLRAGCDKDQIAGYSTARRRNPFENFGPLPSAFRRIEDGDELEVGGRRWRVIVVEGHAPEQASFYCEELNLLIAGDQVLPYITPNITVHANLPHANPLREFIDSFAKLERLPGEVTVLPSHGVPFVGLHQRLAEFRTHHDRRLDVAAEACAGPATALQVMRHMFPDELLDMDFFFALGEALAHLHHLEAEGRITRKADADGVDLFERI